MSTVECDSGELSQGWNTAIEWTD